MIWYDVMCYDYDMTWRDVTWIAACASVFACSVEALWCNVSLSDVCHAFYCGVVCHSTSDMHDDEHDSRLLMKWRFSFDVVFYCSSLSLIWFCALFRFLFWNCFSVDCSCFVRLSRHLKWYFSWFSKSPWLLFPLTFLRSHTCLLKVIRHVAVVI